MNAVPGPIAPAHAPGADNAPPSSRAGRSILRHAIAGLAMVTLLFVGFGVWAANADLAGAVVGFGSMVVDGNLKRVQHQDGGIVGAIMVRDGDRVQANDLLIRLDDTLTRANLSIIEGQIDHLNARRMRLFGERDNATMLQLPATLQARADHPDFDAPVQSEQNLFEARKRLLEAQKQQLRERIVQINQEAMGLVGRRDAKTEEISWIARELDGVETLQRLELTPFPRVAELRRLKAQLAGELGQLTAEIARTRARITETELQILQLDEERQTDAMTGLREIEGKLAELTERRIGAIDKLNRMDIRAPQGGLVHELAVHTVGGVIAPGESVLQIVPSNDTLVVEMRLHPADVDQVHVGQAAVVRLSAFSQRSTPELAGRVRSISADVQRNPQNGDAWYLTRIDIPAEEMIKLGALVLLPGMPAEVFIQTGMRSALSYLVKPISDQLSRAFREE